MLVNRGCIHLGLQRVALAENKDAKSSPKKDNTEAKEEEAA